MKWLEASKYSNIHVGGISNNENNNYIHKSKVDPNLNKNTTTYRYNHKYRDVVEKHFILLMEKC